MEILPYLKLMVEREASDLFFTTGAPVHIKIAGVVHPIGQTPLGAGVVKQLAYSIMSDEQQREFEHELEANLALSIKEFGRFRINVYRQRGEVSMVVRFIRSQIPSLAALGLPSVLERLVLEPRGLVLVVGATGSGKSTTLASMIDHRNGSLPGHIVTIEDPIEYLHAHKKSIVDQREVGLDTLSYGAALKNAMREAPDVILIGEIRDRETMQHAMAYAETGHLCLSTLHANNANQAFDRIVNFFPESAHHQLLLDLSLNMRAIVSQRLLKCKDGTRLPAVEVLLNTPFVSDLIAKGAFADIKEAMERSRDVGMQTFDQAIFDLYSAGRVDLEEALHNADSRNNLSLRIRLAQSGGTAIPQELSIEAETFGCG